MRRLSAIHAVFALLLTCGVATAQDDGPGKRDLNSADYYTRQFEDYVRKANGVAFNADDVGKQSIKRVIALYKKYPKHPKVKALFERVRKCVIASRGKVFKITPEMIAYKQNEKKIVEAIGKKADAQFAKLMAGWKKSGRMLKKAFPARNPDDEGAETDMALKLVELKTFDYPAKEFSNQGVQYCYVGSPAKGMYFVKLDRTWVGAYEAVKRYKRLVSNSLPRTWTIIGAVRGFEMLVPRTGGGGGEVAQLGWAVKIKAIYIPGQILARASGGTSLGGFFEGENDLKKLREQMVTVKEVPVDANPKDVVTGFVTATKEKNLDLHLKLIEPGMRENKVQLQRLLFFWGIQQRAWTKQYVHVDPFKVDKPVVTQGATPKGKSGAGFFLSDKEKKKLAASADELIEEVTVHYRKYDARGKQYGSVRKITLRRYKGKGRWWVIRGWPF